MMTALKRRLSTFLPTCRQVARMQSEALEHPVPPEKRFGLWLHLLLCKLCRCYGNQIRFLNHAAHAHSDKLAEAMPQKLSDEARERIRRRLQAEGE
jgi:hypothetical protein